MRAHQLPITCALYPKKGKRSFASTFLPGTKQIRFGPQGGLHEIQYAGAGFLHVRRQVYLDIQKKLQLPLCNEVFGDELIPFFMPMVQPQRDGHWYLAEDYSFCERARRTGYKIMADTSIRLWYIGSYPYGWEEAGREVERFNDYSYNFE